MNPKKIIFVCSGNTCRSALAEHYARKAISDKGLCGIAVASAGLAVAPGSASPEIVSTLLKEEGIRVLKHRPRPVTADSVAGADLILAMTEEQKRVLLERFPGSAASVFTLSGYAGLGGDIADPYGSGDPVYRAVFGRIKSAVDAALARVSGRGPASKSGKEAIWGRIGSVLSRRFGAIAGRIRSAICKSGKK